MAGSKIFSTTFLVVVMIMIISYTAESALLDVHITKADVGSNGNIVKVKPTHVSVAKKGVGLAETKHGGINVGKDASVASKGVGVGKNGGIAETKHGRITVGKDGSIAGVAANTLSVAKKGRPITGAGKVQAHVLKGH